MPIYINRRIPVHVLICTVLFPYLRQPAVCTSISQAVFIETSVSPATIEALKAAVQDQGHDVVIGGSLFSDAIGEKGSEEGTYVGAFSHNVKIIVEALK